MLTNRIKDVALKVSKMTMDMEIHKFTAVTSMAVGADPIVVLSHINSAIALLIIRNKLKFVEEVPICLN